MNNNNNNAMRHKPSQLMQSRFYQSFFANRSHSLICADDAKVTISNSLTLDSTENFGSTQYFCDELISNFLNKKPFGSWVICQQMKFQSGCGQLRKIVCETNLRHLERGKIECVELKTKNLFFATFFYSITNNIDNTL